VCLAGKRIMKNEMIKTTGRKFGISATVATVVVAAVVGILARKCTKDFEKIVIADTQHRLLTITKLEADEIREHILNYQHLINLLGDIQSEFEKLASFLSKPNWMEIAKQQANSKKTEQVASK